MTKGIDFTNCPRVFDRAYNGANGKKIAVEYDGRPYMLKFPPSGEGKYTCYVRSEDYKALTENPFVLGKAPVPLFYGAGCEDVNTVGGFANWVQDAEYTTCPHCGKPMKYLAQIQWDTVMDGTEGTLYIEFCPECQIVSMQHQQT